MSNAANPILLTTRQAAEFLRLSPRTLEGRRVLGGEPKYKKLLGRVFYTQADLLAWVEASTRTSTSDRGQSANGSLR